MYLSKYIISAGKYYASTGTCKLCEAIDREYKNIDTYDIKDVYTQRRIDNNLEPMLVNGFDLIDTYLSNSVDYSTIKDKILSMSMYNDDYLNFVYKTLCIEYERYNDYNALKPTLLFSRFCKCCGARKHDIFNTELLQRFLTLQMTSELVPHHCHIEFAEDNFAIGNNFKLYRKDKADFVYIADIGDSLTYDDYDGTPTSEYKIVYENKINPTITHLSDGIGIEWTSKGEKVYVCRSVKNADEYIILDRDNTEGNYLDTSITSSYGYEYKILYTNEISVNNTYKATAVKLSWDKLDGYHFPCTYKISKKASLPKDDIDEYLLVTEIADKDILSYIDEEVQDGMAYYYQLEYVNEISHTMHILTTNVLIPSEVDHTPKNISDLMFIHHKYLDDDLNEHESYTAQYTTDPLDTGGVLFKLNPYFVPSLDYWYQDTVFWNNDEFEFTEDNKNIKYFLKPYTRSRLFKKCNIDDEMLYPDNYYWNIDEPAQFFSYSPFSEEIFDVIFTPGVRKMTINFSVKWKHKIKYVLVVFKQVEHEDDYIKNNDFDTYKVLNIPMITALYDYQVDIDGLASNSYWVFGVFPVYENSDADIRIKYQHIEKILPWWEEEVKYDNLTKFYDISKWYEHQDFSRYNYQTNEKISDCDSRDKVVMMCDNLQKKECPPLLIHQEGVSEYYTLDYDFKMNTRTEKDRLHQFINAKQFLKCSNTSNHWYHMKIHTYNQVCAIIRWEHMKMCDMQWCCTFVDNIVLHNYYTKDIMVDNYTRKDTIKLKNVYYYNRTIKHNAVHQHTSDKFYSVEIQINPYWGENDYCECENFTQVNGCAVVGKCDDNFDWYQ